MKQFHLTLTHKIGNQISSINVIEDDNLVSMLAQFNLILVKVMQDIHDTEVNNIKWEERKDIEDDIPF